MERERVRAVRFSNPEIEILLDLIKSYMVVEKKKIDCSTKAVKGRAWGYITAEFRARTTSKRTELQLWKKWKNLKHAARKYDSAMKSKDRLSLQQGLLPHSPILEEVLDVLKKERDVVGQNSQEIDSTVFISTKIKVEDCYENSESVDHSLSSEADSSWLRESCKYPPYEIFLNNGDKLSHVEADAKVETQQTAPSTVETQYRISTRIAGNLTSRNVIDPDGNTSDDAISVGGYSVSSEKNYTSDVNNDINLCPVEADVIVQTLQPVPTGLETQYIIPTQIIGNSKTRTIVDHDGNSSEDAASVEGYSVSSGRNYTTGVNNGINLCRMEADEMVETQRTAPTSIETQYNIPRRIAGNLRSRSIVDHDGNSTEDAVSVEGYSVSSERNYTTGSSIQREAESQLSVNNSGECSSLSNLVLEKELALKSAQLALFEKENQIKDLDIRIREEQLTDIIIWRNREEELHELRKRRIQLGLNHETNESSSATCKRIGTIDVR